MNVMTLQELIVGLLYQKRGLEKGVVEIKLDDSLAN